MVRVQPPSKKKARLTKEQKAASRLHTDEMWNKIKFLREYLQEKIVSLARDYQKTETWASTQVFGGGRLLKKKRKPNVYNAYLHARSKANKENGVEGNGRRTLPELSAQAAKDEGWKNLSEEEKDAILKDLQKKDEDSTVKRVRGVHASHDVGRTGSLIEAELVALSKRTGAQFLVFVVHDDVTDTWNPQVMASDKMKNAVKDMYKTVPEDMVLKLQSYSTCGLAGVIRGSGGKKKSALRSEARDLVTKGLETILLERGVDSDKLPRISYERYEELVTKWGIELVGWPEPGGVKSPGDASYNTPEVERIAIALRNKTCHWRNLTPEEWGERKATREQALLNGAGKAGSSTSKNAKASGSKGKGKANTRGGKGGRGSKAAKSAEIIPTDSELSDEEDEENA